MAKYRVTVEWTAVKTAVVEVEAEDEDDAYEQLREKFNTSLSPARIGWEWEEESDELDWKDTEELDDE